MNRVLRDRGFVVHLVVYLAVNLLLMTINLATNPQQLWFYWPILGWGLGILGHAYAVHRAQAAPPVAVSRVTGPPDSDLGATQIEERARVMWEATGPKAIVEAARMAQVHEQAGDVRQMLMWRRIEAALLGLSGPRAS